MFLSTLSFLLFGGQLAADAKLSLRVTTALAELLESTTEFSTEWEWGR
jgi:hypothetical protein